MNTTTVPPALAERIVADDRRRRRSKRADALTRLAIQIIGVFLRGWWLMLGVGVIHHQWIPACPTIGYGTAVAVAALIGAALVAIPTPNK